MPNLGMAVLVSIVHSAAMITAGGFLAWLVYRYLGLKFVSRSWFNLDATWALSLIFAGEVQTVVGQHGVDFVGNSGDQAQQEVS
jgi:branched-subunit amino acid ABC-type transport system permease component